MDKVLESVRKDKLIVHVITDFSGIGGAEMMLSRLIKHTTNDYKHIIISLMGVSDVYKDTLDQCQEYYNLNWNGLNTVKVIFKLKKILKQISPCTIQCWMYHANVLTTISQLGRTDKPDIFWGIHHSLSSLHQESISTRIGLALSKYFSNHASGIIYCAHSSLKHHEDFGLRNNNTKVIPNGVDLNKFDHYSRINDNCIIGFAGRYHPAKGYQYLFEVISELKEFPLIFKIAGNGANLENAEIAKYFRKYALDENKVILLDQVSNMREFYSSIDLFLMTSITEGFPNVLVEAMASGVPCVSTDVGDARFIIGNYGYIAPSRNIKELKEHILTYLNLSLDEKYKLKKLTRMRVQENFSIEVIAQCYVDFWSK